MIAPLTPTKTGGTTGPKGGARWPIAAGAALALVVLAAVILISLLHLRRHIFEQIANRDGETLDALTVQQIVNDEGNGTITTLEDPSEQIELSFEITQPLQNVIVGVRFFSPDGKYVIADPPRITEGSLSPADLEVLRRTGRPVSHFVPRARPEEHDLLVDTNSPSVPLLEINIALREGGTNQLAGIAQFLVNGSSIAREYAEMDRHLAVQGALTFAISGTILTASFMLSFRRVRKANVLLAERTSNLLKANRELALAAKTSAIGAVTSHLIHGLRNPLSGLRSFVQERAEGDEFGHGSDWDLAITSTQRMQTLIDRVVRVLQEQQMAAEYEISFAELLEIIASKARPIAQAAGVQFDATATISGAVSNREADLISLILENLSQNAIEATPAGKTVHLRLLGDPTQVLIEVEDQGPGLSPELEGRLFTPCSSTKKGGSGIGLTISRQLAVHLSGTLELVRNSATGCCFRLSLPLGASIVPARSPQSSAADGGSANRARRDPVLTATARKSSP